jgi:SAM-dependent methyltransferase
VSENREARVVEGFGDEWTRFDQRGLAAAEKEQIFASYFSLFPWDSLPAGAEGADIGCGSGRWASLVAPRVAQLHCIDASEAALAVARRNLVASANVALLCADVGRLPLPDASLDFAYSLGVLHHVPDTPAAVEECARVLKPGAPFLVYLYYAFDGRPRWFAALWRLTDLLRRAVSRAPHSLRAWISQVLALLVYLPLARVARLGEKAGRDVDAWPLSFYRRRSLYVMRNDALDRFGTRLERRFTRDQIEHLLGDAGFVDVHFREGAPYWVAVARRPAATSA